MKQIGAMVVSLFWSALAHAQEAEEQVAKADMWEIVLFLVLFLAFCAGTAWFMYKGSKSKKGDSDGTG